MMFKICMFKHLFQALIKRLLAPMDQLDEQVKQSLHHITKCLGALQLTKYVNPVDSIAPMRMDAVEDTEYCSLHPLQKWAVQVNFPHFQGKDVLHWIFKPKQFFKYCEISYPYRLDIASIHFDGPVVPWYQMLIKTRTITSWLAMVRALEEDYGPSTYESPEDALFKLTQQDSVANYYASFTLWLIEWRE